ncbi:hypothetical protein BKE38_04045 [Pseudoroseomonas deserti]|uniref:Uncharacterized protein n=1 Tax=Teichococcus deserti TaxID=1817963 RepID=A0A1V2H6F1_9PROT|nr:hypothetical protein [Pseudoroseomonas deserti]ONG57331.1 hypothetical protein BKE38_04045 [Pseudoroseomonas deserti]
MNSMARKKLYTDFDRMIHTGDPLAALDRELLGKSARLHIPLRDVPDMDRIATILFVLAGRLRVLSKDKNRDFSVLFSARQAIVLANAQIRSKPRLGKDSRL